VLAWVGLALGALALGAGGALAKTDVEKVRGTVRTTEHPEPHVLDVLRLDGVDYLDLQDVARLFRATKYWRAELGKMVLKVEGKRVTLTVGSPFVFVDNRGTNLFAPVAWNDGRIVVPVTLATHVLDPIVPERVTWSRETRELRIVEGTPNIQRLTWDLKENGTLVGITLDAPLDGQLTRPLPSRAVVRVAGGRLPEGFETKGKGIGLVDSVEVVEEPDAATFTFHLTPSAGPADLVSRTGPPRLELSVRPPASKEEDVPPPQLETPPAFSEPRVVRTVVLDPGHGGSDKGVVAESGLCEKDVALAIAKRAKDLLEASGLEVHLTREDDRFLSSEARARVANAGKADLFVSVHANGWFDSDLSGFTVEVSKPPPEAGSAQDAVRPWGGRDDAAARDSELLAEIVSRKLTEAEKRPGRGVRSSDWAPLAGATMPAVLVEIGFLTNEDEAKKLGDPDYQGRVAKALADAVREYRDVLARGGDAPGSVGAGAPDGGGTP
jgi:N-acetylmuramoyl-L-alanine amidase